MDKKFLPFSEKYRPKTLADFGFSAEMTHILASFLNHDRIHCLFVGDSGSGKTTLLDVLVQTYYSGYEYAEYMHNILVINNLKDHGFSFFRNEMKTFCQSRSSFIGRKKMVILDDLDLLNKQNQHVFRNYIDKYGEQVHFLMVCGNLQRIIDSLQSRTFILRLPIAPMAHRREIMDRICIQEGLCLTDEAKDYIMRLSNNIAGSSVRNVVNFLEKIWLLNGGGGANTMSLSDKASLSNEISVELCRQVCSAVPLEKYDDFLEAQRKSDLKEAVEILYEIYEYGYSVIDVLDYFFTYVKYTEMLDEEEKYKCTRVLCDYISVYYNVHEHPIELALFAGELAAILAA